MSEINQQACDDINRESTTHYWVATCALLGGAAMIAANYETTPELWAAAALYAIKPLIVVRAIMPLIINALTTPVQSLEDRAAARDPSILTQPAFLHISLPEHIALQNFEEVKQAAGMTNVQLRRFKKPNGFLATLLPALTSPYLNNSVVVVGQSILEGMSDEEQKGVMAHELAHIKLGHFHLRRLGLASFSLASYMALNTDAQSVLGALLPWVPQAVAFSSIRSSETQADVVGATFTKDPKALRDAFRRLGKVSPPNFWKNFNPLFLFFGQHPQTGLRMKRLNTMMTKPSDDLQNLEPLGPTISDNIMERTKIDVKAVDAASSDVFGPREVKAVTAYSDPTRPERNVTLTLTYGQGFQATRAVLETASTVAEITPS